MSRKIVTFPKARKAFRCDRRADNPYCWGHIERGEKYERTAYPPGGGSDVLSPDHWSVFRMCSSCSEMGVPR